MTSSHGTSDLLAGVPHFTLLTDSDEFAPPTPIAELSAETSSVCPFCANDLTEFSDYVRRGHLSGTCALSPPHRNRKTQSQRNLDGRV
jgi:hypothetical protein